MPVNPQEQNDINESSVNIQSFLSFLFALSVGLLAAVIVLPTWMPNMAFSLSGEAPKAYWYLSRSTAFISIGLLWLSMALGMGITNKMARIWPGAAAAFAIHEYVSLLGLAFALFHALLLLGDHYIKFSLAQVLMPFATSGYHPFWVGLGQLGFYIWAMVAFSFYVRQSIGQKTWRLIHFASFGMYVLGLFHAVFSGTDANAGWAQLFYWYTGGSLLFLLVTRIIGTFVEKLFPASSSQRAS